MNDLERDDIISRWSGVLSNVIENGVTQYIYSKADFTIWQIISHTVDNFAGFDPYTTHKFLVVRYPTGSDKKVLKIKELADQFYTLGEYSDFYERHKDSIIDAPYSVKHPGAREVFHEIMVYDEELTFINCTDDDKFIYKYSYTDKDKVTYTKLVKLSSDDFVGHENDSEGLFSIVYGIIEFLEKPISEW